MARIRRWREAEDLEAGDFCDGCGWHWSECECPVFADPGGRSALRAGARTEPCGSCGEPEKLTKEDIALGYQCDDCADRAERGGP
jgi:hypothetical protein